MKSYKYFINMSLSPQALKGFFINLAKNFTFLAVVCYENIVEVEKEPSGIMSNFEMFDIFARCPLQL